MVCPLGFGLGWMLCGDGSLGWLLLFAVVGGLGGIVVGGILGRESTDARKKLAQRFGPLPWWMLLDSERNRKILEGS